MMDKTKYTCKSILGFGVTTKWMRVMMKIDVEASMIQATAVMDFLCEFLL
jgi:hypothetical protein